MGGVPADALDRVVGDGHRVGGAGLSRQDPRGDDPRAHCVGRLGGARLGRAA